MSDLKTILDPAGVVAPRSVCEVKRERCEGLLNIGVFFDGTNNNKNDKSQPADTETNVWKLSSAYKHKPAQGFFSQYVSGVATPFLELGKEKPESGGGPFGAGGEARILFGLLQIFNFAHASIRGDERRYLEIPQLNALCSSTRLPGQSEGINSPLTAEQQILQSLGLQQGLDGASDYVKEAFFRKQCDELSDLLTDRKARPTIAGIYLDVFGFSRGAAQARVFVTWLHRCMLMGGKLFGVPSYVRMLGLFDTVASVGPSDAVGSDGHGGWASAKNLQIHSAVKNCVHYVAMHELRTNFPSDSVRVGDTLPPNCHEHLALGAHSDVGGGYAPLDQGKGFRLVKGTLEPVADTGLRLSNLALNQMYDAALRSCEGHAYKPWLEVGQDRNLSKAFGIDQLEQVRAAARKYFDDCGVPNKLPLHVALREHGMRYLAWRYVVDEAGRFDQLASVRRAQMYPATYTSYRMGQKEFNEQVSVMKRDIFSPACNAKAREIFQRVRELADSNRDKVLAMGAFFDDWVHDSAAGFRSNFYENGKDSSWSAMKHSVAERQGYMRWRNIYQGSDTGLNFPLSMGTHNER